MEPILINRPEIALEDFLPIFLASSFVLIFGLFYVAIYTLVKMKKLKKAYQPFAYVFWAFQTYCMYFVAIKIQSNDFTIKALMVTMVCYLILPHLYYYINLLAEKRYEQ
ncbi:hypothetical protein CP965_05230 [Halarcobacter mediterraneus]|uniref:Uncharacterized protein n=1 Tax=Halarcobacter mediterraneus TaxID=2023153 RepID=A0A4Q1ATJ3_9BACT|nr:hypothetical protein [Halarcobacter mediterraneus]RXK13202.1 hypothetical protein CP965_05230 [Halarcobacter mediterraneus]